MDYTTFYYINLVRNESTKGYTLLGRTRLFECTASLRVTDLIDFQSYFRSTGKEYYDYFKVKNVKYVKS